MGYRRNNIRKVLSQKNEDQHYALNRYPAPHSLNIGRICRVFITGFPDNVNQDDVAAASVAGAGTVALYFLIKLLIGGTTQQWWVFCF